MRQTYKKSHIALVIASSIASGAFAQSTLPTVVVTGDRSSAYFSETTNSVTRTETPIHELPQSVVVLNKSLIEDQGARDMNAALRNVSNVSYVDTRDANNIHVMNIVQKRFGYLFHRGFEAGPFAPPPSVFFCPPSCRLS